MQKINKGLYKTLKFYMTFGAVVLLSGCAATQTALEHRSLETKTSLSKTIFLDPVAEGQKTIFVVVKNTSDQTMNVSTALKNALHDQGYRIVQNPSQAHYLLQANILKVGKMSLAASQAALGGGYGSALAGTVAGAGLGSLSGTSNGVLAGGIAGGLVGLAADSLVKDVNYTMITDVQISERTSSGVKVREQHNASLSNGSSTHLQQSLTRDSQYMRYRTRVVSNAERVNLSFDTARPALEKGLVTTISGIF